MTTTAQDLFNTAYLGVINQGGCAVDLTTSGCLYRTAEGRKCAFGHLIGDELYSENLEGNDANMLIEMGDGFEIFEEHRELITAMQQAHDNAARMQTPLGFALRSDTEALLLFRQNMQDVAAEFGLGVPVV